MLRLNLGTIATEDADESTRALESLTTGIGIGAWAVLVVLFLVALAVAVTLYAANRRRRVGALADDDW